MAVRCGRLYLGTLACVFAHAAAHASPLVPVGPDFQVNTYTFSSQVNPDVAMAPGGSFVVVWTSQYQDGSGRGIFGQRFNNIGGRLGSEFLVNSWTTGEQGTPSVAADPAGGFVVTWRGEAQVGYGTSIFGRRYTAEGVATGPDFQLNGDDPYGTNGYPSVSTGNDRFVVAWSRECRAVDCDPVDAGSIHVRSFDLSAAPLTDPFNVFTEPVPPGGFPGLTGQPDVAVNPTGSFAVTWSGPDADSNGVFARRFDSIGAPLGEAVQVNTFTSGAQTGPALSVDSQGQFIFVWLDTGHSSDGDRIAAIRLDGLSGVFGSQFDVTAPGSGSRGTAAVASQPGGDFLVVWQDTSELDGSKGGIVARQFTSTGEPYGTEFQVNTYTLGDQGQPAVASTAGGLFVVVWQDGTEFDTGRDGSRGGIFAQLFAEATSTATPTATPTWTSTPTETPTSTDTPTVTPTNTPTDSPTATVTDTATPTPTDTPTPTPSDTPTATWTHTPTATPTTTLTATVTASPTVTATQTATHSPTLTPIACVGDCNGSGAVTIDEIVRGVSIALGNAPLSACIAFDRNSDAEVGIFELINAVRNALSGCRPPL